MVKVDVVPAIARTEERQHREQSGCLGRRGRLASGLSRSFTHCQVRNRGS